MALISGRSCRTCKFAEKANTPGAIECRRYPPQVGPVIVPVKPGMAGVEVYGGFPRHAPDVWCGEWAPQLAVLGEQVTSPGVVMRIERSVEAAA